MIDKAHELAQSVADGLSRRSFLGGIGRAATLVAAACGGLLAVPDDAYAGRRCKDDSACPKGQLCVNGRCRKPKKDKEPPSK